MRQGTTLVLGGTGKTGRRVVERLTARGVPTRVGSRSGEPPFDWEDRSTWAPALDGVTSAYVSYYPDIAIPGAVEKVRSFAELALERGARRLVLLTGRIADDAADVAPMFFHFGEYLTSTFPSTFDFVQLPEAGQVHPDLAMTKVVGGEHADAAEAWIRFMRTDIARDIYTSGGFDYASDAELGTRVVPCTPPAP